MSVVKTSAWSEFLPKSVQVLREGYSRRNFVHDAMAGLTVGIVALPLAMAFAIASGVPPERGLYTAIVAGFLTSLLGGSRFQIGGPTGAFVVIIASVMHRHGYEGLVLCTLMAGALLILLGLCRFGALIKFIPYPVTTGFTAGIAVLIFSSQMKDLFGLDVTVDSPHFLTTWSAIAHGFHTVHAATIGVGLGSLAVILLTRRFAPRIPAPFAGVVLASIAVWAFGLDTATIGSRFGGIPDSLPEFSLPAIDMAKIPLLIPDALTIALLAGIESLLSCVVADGMSGDRHNSNVELTAQGAANIGAVLLGGISATGAIARTATNIRSGAATPVAGMMHAAVLVGFILFLAPLAAYIPLASLAAVLVVVAFDMSEVNKFMRLFNAPRSDVLVMCLTLLLTVLVDLTVAVYVGVLMAALLFMRRMSEVTQIKVFEGLDGLSTAKSLLAATNGQPGGANAEPEDHDDEERLNSVQVYEIDGPFFFGMADRFMSVLQAMSVRPKVLILRLRRVPVIDATAANALETVVARFRKKGSAVILAEVRPSALEQLRRLGSVSRVGEGNVVSSLAEAFELAHAIVENDAAG